jgi:hypothetical protein
MLARSTLKAMTDAADMDSLNYGKKLKRPALDRLGRRMQCPDNYRFKIAHVARSWDGLGPVPRDAMIATYDPDNRVLIYETPEGRMLGFRNLKGFADYHWTEIATSNHSALSHNTQPYNECLIQVPTGIWCPLRNIKE